MYLGRHSIVLDLSWQPKVGFASRFLSNDRVRASEILRDPADRAFEVACLKSGRGTRA